MCKLIVILYRRQDFTRDRCLVYLRDVHGPMAERLPGLVAYRQNHVVEDATRCDPEWDAVVELCWETREAMENAWRTPEGQAATDDLAAFADLERTSWSIVDEQIRR
ncbi:MAG: EthD family reductase [Luteitalea sp.]|nr:EthD family reductase [Luteitalea sp.]